MEKPPHSLNTPSEGVERIKFLLFHKFFQFAQYFVASVIDRFLGYAAQFGILPLTHTPPSAPTSYPSIVALTASLPSA